MRKRPKSQADNCGKRLPRGSLPPLASAVALVFTLSCVLLVKVPLAWSAFPEIQIKRDVPCSKIALHYYGVADKCIYLQQHNGVFADIFNRNARLDVPHSWTYKVRRGDSISLIAKQHLGEMKRFRFLLAANKIRNPNGLAVGQELLMPFHLEYLVEKGQSYSQIANSFYSGQKLGEELAAYNANVALQPNQKIIVPIFDGATLEAAGKKPKAQWLEAPIAKDTNAKIGANQIATSETASSTQAPKPVDDAATDAPPPTNRPAAAQASASKDSSGGHQVKKPGAQKQRAILNNAQTAWQLGFLFRACKIAENIFATENLSAALQSELYFLLLNCALSRHDNSAAKDFLQAWLEMSPNHQMDSPDLPPKARALMRGNP